MAKGDAVTSKFCSRCAGTKWVVTGVPVQHLACPDCRGTGLETPENRELGLQIDEPQVELCSEIWLCSQPDDESPYVCPGCYAVGDEPCAADCIDAEIEREHEEALQRGDYERNDHEDE